tara:strand:- start:2736 stop:3536 length:801 start_codon:yes stop_codon:yes gene_type:complete
MLHKILNGHSGCKVLLCENDKTKYVRKISKSFDYNTRLQAQMKKQDSFFHSNILSPKIYSSGNKDNLFYFDMEYISGISLSEFIRQNTVHQIEPIIEKVFSHLFESRKSYIVDTAHEIDLKIEKISEFLSDDYNIYKNYCRDYDWKNTEINCCHGDLTFENIMIYKGNIYFIDFLDSFIESHLIDVSKIMQDLLIGWSWRFSETHPFIKSQYIYESLKSRLTSCEMETCKRLLVLNLLRIVPYTTDKNTSAFINNKLKHLRKVFKI